MYFFYKKQRPIRPRKNTHITKPVKGTPFTFWGVWLAGETICHKFPTLQEAYEFAEKSKSLAKIVID